MNNYFDNLTNPFLIDIEDKEDYTYNDYINIQNKLKKKNIDIFLKELYSENMNTTFEEIKRRVTKGITLDIIDKSNNIIIPTIQVYKIGNGGDNCFVCYTSLFNDRFDKSQNIIDSFKKNNFDGYFLLLNGGFPNPTGKEMKYCGVPYSFKIFMMLEANKLGFEKIIWIDAACYCVNNPKRLFDLLVEDDVIFRVFPPNCFSPNTMNNITFPKTIELLNNIVNRDIRNDYTINSIVFGLNFGSEKIKKFINEYYQMVEFGLPFLSSFPEEIVFTVIFNKLEYKHVFKERNERKKLYIHETYLNEKTAKNYGYFFLQRSY
jgi:hypothetical protein